MHRSQLYIVALLLISALFFGGCYVNDQGVLVMGTPTPAETTDAAEPVAEDEPTDTGPVITEPITLTATVNTRSLRVRQGASTETPIVAGLQQGTEITVIGRSTDGAWLQIQIPDVQTNGWVSSEFVIVDGEVANLPITDGSGEDTMTPEATAPAEAEATPDEEAATGGEAAEATATPVSEPVSPQINLVETASAISEFSTLVEALQAAGLAEVLAGEGPYTVFAPTDNAFAALPEGALNALLADPEGALSQVLLSHVVPERFVAADLTDGLEVETVQGETLTINVDGDNIMVNGANVTLTDVEASNGVIHVIDSVLIPESVNIASAIAAMIEAEVAADATDLATPAPTVTSTLTATTPVTGTAVGEPITLAETEALAEVNTGSPQSLRVRQEPSTEADIVWGARNGEFYAVTEQSPDGAWVGLAIPELSGTGWVSTEFVTITTDIAVIPTLGSITVATSDGARLRVRNVPSVDGELLDYLNEGETYEVVAVTTDGAWALINIPETAGPSWVATEFVQIGAPQR
jgi:uncharacterized surface protein with fasciclin (FAS1) repeats/uncharacterized protein YgiM (DUF1202 family)